VLEVQEKTLPETADPRIINFEYEVIYRSSTGSAGEFSAAHNAARSADLKLKHHPAADNSADTP
jgi:hypothetical protein